eukprot:529823_1
MAEEYKQMPLVIVPKDTDYMSCDELAIKIKKKHTNMLVIDVRDPNIDYNGGHIPNAVNIPYDKFDDSMEEIIQHILSIDKLSQVIIHCMESKHRGPRCCNKFIALKKQICNQTETKQLTGLPLVMDKIKVYLLTGGFQKYVNKYHKQKHLIQDFDKKYWNQNDKGFLSHNLYDATHNEKLLNSMKSTWLLYIPNKMRSIRYSPPKYCNLQMGWENAYNTNDIKYRRGNGNKFQNRIQCL